MFKIKAAQMDDTHIQAQAQSTRPQYITGKINLSRTQPSLDGSSHQDITIFIRDFIKSL